MDTRDITSRQLDTLILVHSLEEFITDEHENLMCLSDVIFTFEESMSDDEHINFVEDIVKLSKTGYLESDAIEEHITNNIIPEVEGITPKGKTLLDEFERETKEKIASGEKVTIFENFTYVNFNPNLLVNININSSFLDTVGSLFKFIGKVIKK